MNNPGATYRIQFHKGFNFNDFEAIIPYLQRLGIGSIYASPIFEANPGSTHGYDILNPNRINPEIGDLATLKRLSKKLKGLGISWIQDIVPNHMAFSPANIWLESVFEKGPESPFYRHFDIDWNHPGLKGRLMAPFLGGSVPSLVKKGSLKLDRKNNKHVLLVDDLAWPLSERSQAFIQSEFPAVPTDKATSDAPAFQKLNGGPKKLQKILDLQFFELCSWKESFKRLNFRRFFTVNSLICLNMQDEQVFSDYHKLILSLVKEDVFQGLRIDHLDGLADPAAYLSRLRKEAGNKIYLVVEKILARDEELPIWPVQGNTGYDFIASVDNLFSYPGSEEKLEHYYKKIVPGLQTVDREAYEKKSAILFEQMQPELDNLIRFFLDLGLSTLAADENFLLGFKESIAAFLASMPVYRYYGNTMPLALSEQKKVRACLQKARKKDTSAEDGLALLEDIWLNHPLENDPVFNKKALRFYQRCMQFSGPVMAKGVEDTLMYCYNSNVLHNEVGNAPASGGMVAEHFHALMASRAGFNNLSLNAASTHDTKRAEDSRARLAVLTEHPERWIRITERWRQFSRPVVMESSIDENDEYLIYQSLIASYPLLDTELPAFKNRFKEFLTKALREGKVNSNWKEPNLAYEKTVRKFADHLLGDVRFQESFKPYLEEITAYGMLNSISQLILRMFCPGIPDFYQGSEIWNYSMVDPDNRRPVNFKETGALLERSDSIVSDTFQTLWNERKNGKIKIRIIQNLLTHLKEDRSFLEKASYVPLQVKGKYADHVFAFARNYQETWYIIAIPLFFSALRTLQKKENDLDQLDSLVDWADTELILPEEFPFTYEDLLSGKKGIEAGAIPFRNLFKSVPFSVLKLKKRKNPRGAGILLHISSLPSAFGTGDLGPEAYAFADYLRQSGQRFWQVLPLNPISADRAWSPYSSISGIAGNTLFISPEKLLSKNWLVQQEIDACKIPLSSKSDFRKAKQNKDLLLEKAWPRFREDSAAMKEFHSFAKQESGWLDDFALYVVIRQHFQNQPWNEWPEPYRNRHAGQLAAFRAENGLQIEKVKWRQFLFFFQWQDLKSYCHSLDIQLIGDLPFYLAYDSAEVWSEPENFNLDSKGAMKGTAGVPPDYFNEDGQLWGMPTFNWSNLKTSHYALWLRRFEKNMQLFDVIRLDHFRAFVNYWEVPAGFENARSGTWEKGPSSDFFKFMKSNLSALPFIAEDLGGDLPDEVEQLRKEFDLPGMKVLQFGFGSDLPFSEHIPHHAGPGFFIYTGTHDNDTILGWYRTELKSGQRKDLELYTGLSISEKNIHEVMIRLAYASISGTAIIPMQDVLGLDERSRMNRPAAPGDNWLWRLDKGQTIHKPETFLLNLTKMFDRL